jgi:hypothetical protein
VSALQWFCIFAMVCSTISGACQIIAMHRRWRDEDRRALDRVGLHRDRDGILVDDDGEQWA